MEQHFNIKQSTLFFILFILVETMGCSKPQHTNDEKKRQHTNKGLRATCG